MSNIAAKWVARRKYIYGGLPLTPTCTKTTPLLAYIYLFGVVVFQLVLEVPKKLKLILLRGGEMETVALVIIAATFVMGFTDSAIAEKETGVIHVGGNVLCQDCTQGWNEWAHGGNPIKGCKVSITCMDERSRVVYYGSDMTDELGQFDIIVNKYINGKKMKTKLCWVRLVSSPHPTCNILTDFAGGRRGVKLSLPTLVYRDQTEYTLGPFYFTSPLCDEPDTNDNSNNPHQGTHY